MRLSYWSLRWVAAALCGLMILGLVTPRAMQAGAPKNEDAKRTYVLNLFKQVNHPDPDVGYEAVLELEAMGMDVVPVAIEQLTKLDNNNGVLSAFILGEVDDLAVIDTLLATLQNSKSKGKDDNGENGDVDLGGVSVSIQSEKARNLRDGLCCLSLGLRGAMLDENDKTEAECLDKIKHQLRKYLRADIDRVSFVKTCAAIALGMALDDEAVKSFIDIALDTTQNLRLRCACLLSLSSFPTDNAREALETLIASFPPEEEQEDWKTALIHEYAALALGTVGTKSSEPVILKSLNEMQDANARSHAILALAELGQESSLAPVQQALISEKDVKVRTCAARTLYELGDHDGAYAMLEKILYDPKSRSDSLVYATQILGTLLNDRSKDMLVRLLGHPKMDVRRLAASNLVKFANAHESVRTILLDIASDRGSDRTLRQQAGLAFRYWDLTPENIEMLKFAARTDFNPMKRCVALALAKRSSSPKALGVLAELMADKMPLNRAYAAMAYGSTAFDADEKALTGLKNLAERDESYLVRANASLSLQALASKDMHTVDPVFDRYWRQESLAPRHIWEEFWEHALLRLLRAAIDEAGSADNATGPGVGTETTTTTTYDPVTCGQTTTTTTRVKIRDVFDPGQIAEKVVSASVRKHYYGPRRPDGVASGKGQEKKEPDAPKTDAPAETPAENTGGSGN